MRGWKSRRGLDVLPLPIGGTLEDCIADALGFQGVFEARVGWLAGIETLEEIGDLVGKGVFVADLQAGNPPVAHVGLVSVGDMDAAPASHDGLIVVIEVLQAVQVVQVPGDAGVFAVDFQGIEGLVATCIAGRLEESERAVIEVAEERASVVDVDGGFFSGLDVGSFFDERFGHCADIVDRTVDPKSRVDAVGQKVARHTASGRFGIESPCRRSTLGNIGVDGPVLEKVGSVVEDASELS